MCKNCQAANQTCIQSQSAIEYHRGGPGQAAFERISSLEAQLSAALRQISALEDSSAPADQTRRQVLDDVYCTTPTHESIADTSTYQNRSHRSGIILENQHKSHEKESHDAHQLVLSGAYSQNINSHDATRGHIADVVGFLSLGDSVSNGEPAYIGSSSGFSLAINLEQMVQATVWTKALASTVSEAQPRALSIADLRGNSADPPNNDMGDRILDAYFKKMHVRYPFLDRTDIWKLHEQRFHDQPKDPKSQYNVFKLYMVYAIGSTMLQLTETYGTSV